MEKAKTHTILLGNGINYLSAYAVSWEDLLIELMGDDKFEMKYLPNLMTYERIRLNWEETIGNTNDLKRKIAERLKNQSANEYYKKILRLNFRNFLTTNYDYAILKSFLEMSFDNYVKNNGTEEIYSLRRYKELINSNKEVVSKVWNIHGELDSPKTIMLGMNHYCGSVGKIDQYLKGKYDFKHKEAHLPIKKIEEKIDSQTFDEYSWVELFFSSNIHIAGFGLDFSEIDIWWILTVRARLMKTSNPNNRIYYYTRPFYQVTKEVELESRKREMLQSLFVDIVEVPLSGRDYKDQWDGFLSIMASVNY